MIDIKLIRENKEFVKENIKKKFQDQKLVLVDEVEELDKKAREVKMEADALRAKRNELSASIGELMREKKKEDAESIKQKVVEINEKLTSIEEEEEKLNADIKERMMVIPNIMDESVPIGKDDSENVENEKFGEPVVPEFEVPYHADIIARLNGIDKEAAGRTSEIGRAHV